MHYPPHVTLLLASLLILRDDAGAAKNGFNADVLTSFAKNVASVLSTTLLGDYQDPPFNQSSPVLLKRLQDAPSPVQNKTEESKANFSRYSRYAPSSEDQSAFQDADTTNTHNYPKYYNPESYNSYKYPINPSPGLPPNVQTSKNVYTDSRTNSIDADFKAVPFNYPNQPQSERNRYNPIDLRYYQQIQTQLSADGQSQLSEDISESNENQARITRRPFNINYSPAYPSPYHPGPPPGVYPGNRQPANDEPAATGQDGSSRVVDDQNQGQSTLGYGYDSPQFNYRPPYPDGFYPGYPGFYPRPFNDTNPVDPRNGSGPYPFGPPFYDPKFGPYFPYQQPYPNFPGKSGQNGNQEQADAQQNEPNTNNTQNYPYGFLPYGPEGYPFPGYPLPPFHGVPYNFGYGFPNYLVPKIRVPYFNFYPGPYNYFPFGYPYGGYVPYNNRPAMMPEKPGDAEKTGEAANGEAEMLSATKSDMMRAMLKRYEKRSSDLGVKSKK